MAAVAPLCTLAAIEMSRRDEAVSPLKAKGSFVSAMRFRNLKQQLEAASDPFPDSSIAGAGRSGMLRITAFSWGLPARMEMPPCCSSFFLELLGLNGRDGPPWACEGPEVAGSGNVPLEVKVGGRLCSQHMSSPSSRLSMAASISLGERTHGGASSMSQLLPGVFSFGGDGC